MCVCVYVCFPLCVRMILVLFNFGLNLSKKFFFLYLKCLVLVGLIYGAYFKLTLTTFI